MRKRKPETGKQGVLAEKARETVSAWLRAAIARARKLRPYATKALETVEIWWIACTSKLRPHAARLLETVHGGYRAAVAAIGKRSPRTAKAIEACETWLLHNWRRVALGALAVVLVLGIGFAAIFPEAAGRTWRVLSASNRVVPLPEETRRAVREKAKQLAAALDRRLDRKLAGEAWPSAQILVALRENDPDYAIDVKQIEQAFRSVAGPECACWRRFPQGKYPNHLGVTSWALWTFAQYGIPAHKSELEFLLSTQGADGGWPLFAGAQQEKQQEKFASSYGTAAAILALHEQSPLQSDPEQKKRLAAAVKRGAVWLKSRAVAGRARWTDYPAWPEVSEEFLGVSGFALFALHRVGASWLGSLDSAWLRELPAQAPAARDGEASGKTVQVGSRSYQDETRYYDLPWTILATAEVYRSAWIFGKVRAVEWLERALAPGASIHELTGREKNAAIVAEALLALRSEVKHE
jgi:hypothetical protein